MVNIQQLYKWFNGAGMEKGENSHPLSLDHLEKRYMLLQMLLAFSGIALFLLVGLAVKATLIVEFCLVYLPVLAIADFFFYTAKKIGPYILVFKLLMILISSVYIARMGGMFTSGGLFLLAIQAVTSTVILRKINRTLPVILVFVVAMLCLLLFEPYFPVEHALDPYQNRVIFVANLLAITGFIFYFSLYAIKLFSEQERLEAQRQKELNDAKTRLYTNITHEFRTPLTVILGLADSMQQTSGNSIDAKCETIKRNGKNLMQLVDQMLDLSKMESGKMSVKKIRANILPFLRYIFHLHKYTAGEKNISMYFESDKQGYEMEFDPDKTGVIVSNLLTNAIKFTPSGGRVDMKVFRLNDHLNISILDNGCGIPEDKQSRIFDRFYQADDGNTRKEGGAGIGLSVVNELVKLLDGTIGLRSEPGVETIFTVTLPALGDAQVKTEKETAKQEQGLLAFENEGMKKETATADNKERLLIIEDNRDVMDYLSVCYEDNFRISRAGNGLEGYQVALREIPDIVISDVMMPEMDGFELCKKLKDDYRTSHIPIILLTAKADIPSRIEGLEKGADAYVVKPFNQQELLIRMQKLLELRRKLFKAFSNRNENGYAQQTDPLLEKENQFMRKLDAIVQQHLNNEKFSIELLCSEMAMSKSQLYRKFKALTNQTVARYMRRLRMQKARELLLTRTMNVSEVGYEVGMKSLSTFSQLFKEEFGKSPREYLLHPDPEKNA